MMRAKNRDIEILNYDTVSPGGIRELIWSALFAVMLLAGIMLAYLSCVPLGGTSAVIFCTSGIAVTLLSALLCRVKKLSGYSPLTAAAAAVIAAPVMGLTSIANGFIGFLNYIISWYNIKYDDIRQLLPSGNVTESGILAFSVVFILLAAALCWWTARERGLLRGAVITAAVSVGGSLIGRFSPAACACLTAGLIGMILFRNNADGQHRKAAWFAVICALLTVSAFAAGSRNVPAVDKLRKNASDTIDNLRFGKDTLPEGDLSLAYKMLDGDKPTLTVSSDHIKNIYLKGFCGGRYSGGKWQLPPRGLFGGEYGGMLEWLGERSFSPQLQYGGYITAGGAGEAEENTIKITNNGARRNYIYLPYSASAPQKAAYDKYLDAGLVSRSLFGSSKYEFKETSDNIPCELIRAGDWLSSPANAAEENYARSEAVYRQFVYDSYTKVDAYLEPLIHSLFIEGNEAKISDGVYVVTDCIRAVLTKNALYSDLPGRIPADAEPIEWFLTSGRRGNSALFASAAVQAYRAFGIPARYAEGYYISEDDISDGKGTAQLTNKNSHAWAEVYLDGIGWVPVDVTPGFYYDSYALRQMVEQPRGIMRSAAEDDSENKADESGSDVYDQNDKYPGFAKTALKVICGIITLIILLLCLLLLLVAAAWLIRYMALKKRFRKADPAAQVSLLCVLLQKITAVLGVESHPGWNNDETERALREKFPDIREGEYLHIAKLTEKHMYSGEPLRPHEIRAITALLRKLYSEKTDIITKLKLGYNVFKG